MWGQTTEQNTWEATKGTTDMLDYRFNYAEAMLVSEERVHRLRRERRLQAQLRRVRRLPEPRPEGRRRWNLASFLGLVTPDREAR